MVGCIVDVTDKNCKVSGFLLVVLTVEDPEIPDQLLKEDNDRWYRVAVSRIDEC